MAKKYFQKKIKGESKDDLRAKEIVRNYNLATRMDLGYKKGEVKKKRSQLFKK